MVTVLLLTEAHSIDSDTRLTYLWVGQTHAQSSLSYLFKSPAGMISNSKYVLLPASLVSSLNARSIPVMGQLAMNVHSSASAYM